MIYQPAWHLTGSPYSVQLEAMRRSEGHDKFAYFLEMGLGKSALWLNEYVERYSDIDTVVIICPHTFRFDWGLAPAEWGLSIKAHVWPRDEFTLGKKGEPNFFIMNFESVRASGFDHVKKLLDARYSALVVDESASIKNYRSQTARAVLDLAKRAKVVRLLNGTPIGNNVMDLYSQLRTIGELNGMNPYVFRNRFALTGGFMGKQVIGVKNEPELHKILDACSFRATKAEWSDLPPKSFIPVRLEMTKKQAKIYKEMLDDFFTVVDGKEFSASMALARCDKLRQVASGLIMEGDKWALLEEPADNPKIKAELELIETGGGKTVIVHYYVKIGQVILEEMERKGLSPAFIRGGMKHDEVIEQKRRFNNDPDCRVLVAQITSASRAHTLLGGEGNDRAHKMIFHDGTFSYIDRNQMTDRIHRGAQDRTCLYFDLLMSPIDEAQLKALGRKQDIATAVVDAVRALRIGSASGSHQV